MDTSTTPPMHRECAEYALRTCPHLARAKGKYAPLPDATEVAKLGAGRIAIGGMVTEKKAEHFALMHGRYYSYIRTRDNMLAIKAQLPWEEIIWWRDGEPERR